MRYNRVGSEIAKKRLAEKIITPLKEVSEKPMEDLNTLLVRASKENDRDKLTVLLRNSTEQATFISNQLDTIVDEMVQWQNRQELANQLKMVISLATKVLKGIEQEARKESGSIFERNKNEK